MTSFHVSVPRLGGEKPLLTDYSRFKADIGSAKRGKESRPSQPPRHHRSTVGGCSNTVFCNHHGSVCGGGASICPNGNSSSVVCGPVGNRTSIHKLEEEMQRILVQVAFEQSGHDYTVTTTGTADLFNESDSDSSDSEDDEEDGEVEDMNMSLSYSRPVRTYGNQSMPMLGLQDFSPVLAPPSPTPRRLSNQFSLNLTTATTANAINTSSIPNLSAMNSQTNPNSIPTAKVENHTSAPALFYKHKNSNKSSSVPSLTDYMETFAEDQRRVKSRLHGTRCATEDLRQELYRMVLPPRRRQKTLPPRSKTWDEKLRPPKTHPFKPDTTIPTSTIPTTAQTQARRRSTIRKSKSVDPDAMMTSIPMRRRTISTTKQQTEMMDNSMPASMSMRRRSIAKQQQQNEMMDNSMPASLPMRRRSLSSTKQLQQKEMMDHSMTASLPIRRRSISSSKLQDEMMDGSTTKHQDRDDILQQLATRQNKRSTIRKSKSSIDDDASPNLPPPCMARRFRRHRKNNNSGNNLQHLHNSTGQILYDFHSDILGTTCNKNSTFNNNNETASRRAPIKYSKSFDSSRITNSGTSTSSPRTLNTTAAVAPKKKNSC
ncbi:expressed unknown protein [Seminavis robusta]|uniref:Uncharacterized protein n=1 Tax=Seminavis robusta TaxID=568900 RepID=A0A9N8HRY7_9STRA|nr:expressed unknown protein [Seminavis robusta]|eukprot:Sro1119_g243180.1 n/a (599) ;mRNA; f:12936-14903